MSPKRSSESAVREIKGRTRKKFSAEEKLRIVVEYYKVKTVEQRSAAEKEAPGPGQVDEVFEHILHYANDVGLHYTFPEEWAVTTDSQLYQFMREAIDKGYYNIRSDIDSENGDRRVRGLLQEFGYWVISTAWNLQEPYGPDIEEWTIRNRADLQAKMPELYEMYEQTVGKIMASPSLATLDTFNP